jgi:hypothetical protein
VVYLEIEKLFEAFLNEKQFLCGVSSATVRIYSKSWAAYKRYVGCACEITGDRLTSLTPLICSQAIVYSFGKSWRGPRFYARRFEM